MEIGMVLLGLIIGLVFMYFVLRPKLTAAKEIDQQIEEQNKILQQEKIRYSSEIKNLQNIIGTYKDVIGSKKAEIQSLEVKEEEIKKFIAQIEENNNIIYEKSYNLMQEHLDKAAEEESKKFQKAQELAKDEYLNVLKDMAAETAKELEQKRADIAKLNQELSVLRAKSDAAIAAAKREEEKLLEIDKYKILVTEQDLLEINRLREIAPYFRNSRAIYKIIWESYYRNLTTELINRIIGAGTHTGIYKITDIKNQKIYIGQATDLSARLKEHIKCGLGIDTPSNMLYTAMLKDGVENFTFEVLEECDRSQLNDREKYYIEFYRSQEWGFNMSKGGARS